MFVHVTRSQPVTTAWFPQVPVSLFNDTNPVEEGSLLKANCKTRMRTKSYWAVKIISLVVSVIMPSCVDVLVEHTATFFRVLGTKHERRGTFYPSCFLEVYSVFLHRPIGYLHCIPSACVANYLYSELYCIINHPAFRVHILSLL